MAAVVEEEKTKMKNRPCMIKALGGQPKVGCCPHTIDQLQTQWDGEHRVEVLVGYIEAVLGVAQSQE